MKSSEITRTMYNTDRKDKFLDEEKKQIFSTEKDIVKPDFFDNAYNKRFGHATVYDNKFKNIAKEMSSQDNERSSTLSNAGSNLMAKNPNLNVYQHQQMLRSSPFGASMRDSGYSKITSSSAYGSFFNKRKM